jgi:glycosyltransferase involved in cell wall biosynthesis
VSRRDLIVEDRDAVRERAIRARRERIAGGDALALGPRLPDLFAILFGYRPDAREVCGQVRPVVRILEVESLLPFGAERALDCSGRARGGQRRHDGDGHDDSCGDGEADPHVSSNPENCPETGNFRARPAAVDGRAFCSARAVSRHASSFVSIITPAFNASQYLSHTIASALGQSFRHFELLVADDGSTDDTLALARTWERTDSRVRVFTHRNGGSGSARNMAMRAARGDFFAFLDSDDLWLPEFLASQLEVFRQFPEADIVTGNAYNLGGPADGKPLTPLEGRCRRLSLLDILEHEDIMCIMSVFRRSVYERIGGIDETLHNNEDYDYWLRAARAGCVIVKNPAPLARYRRHPQSKSANELHMLTSITHLLQRFREGCEELPAEKAAIDRQLARFNERRVLESAKASLTRRRFADAAREFETLSKIRRDLPSGMFARMSRHAPHLLLWAYQVQRALRSRRQSITRA